MCLTLLYVAFCVLSASKELPFVLPDVKAYASRLAYLGFDQSQDFIIVFPRSDSQIVSDGLGLTNSPTSISGDSG